MAGESGSDPSRSLPLRRLFQALLIGSFFSIWIGSSDPWWRVKEWVVLAFGAGWLSWRLFDPPKVLRNGRSIPLALLFGWIVLQLWLLQIFPVIQAQGKLFSSPWPWLVFLHLTVISIWFSDGVRGLSRDDLFLLARLIGVIGSVLSVYMILQGLGMDPILLWVQHSWTGFKWLSENHVVGLVGNPFQAGMCLAACVPAIVALFHPTLALMAGYALWTTQSSSAIVAGLIGVLIVLWKQCRDLTWKALLGLSLVGFLRVGKDFLDDSGRLEIWAKSLSAWAKHPWIGYGLGQYKLLGISLSNPVAGRPPTAVRWAHNEWIQFGVELGIVGIILLILWVDQLGKKCHLVCRVIPAEWLGISATCLVLSVLAIPWHLAPTAVVTLMALMALTVISEEGLG